MARHGPGVSGAHCSTVGKCGDDELIVVDEERGLKSEARSACRAEDRTRNRSANDRVALQKI